MLLTVGVATALLAACTNGTNGADAPTRRASKGTDGGAAQRNHGKTADAADAAHRRSGRKLVTGVQVLAFPNE